MAKSDYMKKMEAKEKAAHAEIKNAKTKKQVLSGLKKDVAVDKACAKAMKKGKK